MILPNKYLREQDALIGVGAIILKWLTSEKPLSILWEELKNEPTISNFERFILGLDLLFLFGLIEFRDNKIARVI